MVTVAPEAVSLAQVEALAKAGVVVSLGHTGCTEAEARAAIRAGASAVTHLYNAMSPLGHRAPGLVGAALESSVWIGIIPDGVHVAETAFRIASRLAGGRLFAVTDAMAVAGTDLESFTLGGRTILRQDGRLTLQDGTLAGADVTMPQALAWMNGLAHDRLADASRLTSGVAATVLRLGDRGWLGPGARADMVHLREDGALAAVWRGGARLA